MVLSKRAAPKDQHGRPEHSASHSNALPADLAAQTQSFAPAPSAFQLTAKRLVDILGALCALIVLLPIILPVAILIRLNSRGPALSRRLMLGRDDIPFEMLTFRCRPTRVERATGDHRTDTNDLTPIGRFLDRTRLYELPQLWNVLVGDMSFIGPQAHAPDMRSGERSYGDMIGTYPLRRRMRPGMTGLAQSEGLDTADHPGAIRRSIIRDIDYIKNFSLALDMKILMRAAMREIASGTRS